MIRIVTDAGVVGADWDASSQTTCVITCTITITTIVVLSYR